MTYDINSGQPTRRQMLMGIGATGAVLTLGAAPSVAEAGRTSDSIFRLDLHGKAARPYEVGPLKSAYAPMRDNVRIALDVVRPAGDGAATKRDTILVMTRYLRGVKGKPSNQYADLFVPHGYAVVVGDVRGTGASFGKWLYSRSTAEVDDYREVMDWIVAQPWSTGAVVGYGHSYTANTADFMAVHNHSALKGLIAESGDYDPYETLFPNGVPPTNSTWKTWSDSIKSQDLNLGSPGVRPVGPGGEADLEAAVREHEPAPPIWDGVTQVTFRDDRPTTWGGAAFLDWSIQEEADRVSHSSTPTQYWAGWFDAATPEGAVRRFLQVTNPMSVVIGPWPHRYDSPYDPLHDPLRPANDVIPPATPARQRNNMRFADLCFSGRTASEQGKVLHYYTLGEGVWKSTRSWPIPATRRRWYMADGLRLTSAPISSGFDSLQVDPELGDVVSNRWASSLGHEVNYGDRQQFDAARLAYTSEPLTHDVEITGHPIVHLKITSTREDGNFFAYLEAVGPDGVSCYLTEGELRALHRKVWTDSPFSVTGPQHSCLKRDAEPLNPGEPAILEFTMQPISARVPAGFRLRVCLAGSDKTNFATVPADGMPPQLDFHHGPAGCYIDLPIIED